MTYKRDAIDFETVKDLIAAYESKKDIGPLVLDNDTADAYDTEFVHGSGDRICRFTIAPDVLLRELLSIVGIPWEEC